MAKLKTNQCMAQQKWWFAEKN